MSRTTVVKYRTVRRTLHSPCKMLRGVLRSSVLRQAAVEVGRLPEFADAMRLYANANLAGSVRQLERVTEVMQHVPVHAMQLVSTGALAQALRGTGQLAREYTVWVSALKRGDDRTLRAHELNHAAACALHQGKHADALVLCDEGRALCKRLPDELRWETVFCVYRALALSHSPAEAAKPLERVMAQMETACSTAEPSTQAAGESARLILGDLLINMDRSEEAAQLWRRGLLSDEVLAR